MLRRKALRGLFPGLLALVLGATAVSAQVAPFTGPVPPANIPNPPPPQQPPQVLQPPPPPVQQQPQQPNLQQLQQQQLPQVNGAQGSPGPMRNVVNGLNQGAFMANHQAQTMMATFGNNTGLATSPGAGLSMPMMPARASTAGG